MIDVKHENKTIEIMQTTSVKLYYLNYRQAVTYGAALLFVAGNIAMPQLCHLVPQGGLILLPIYFFTLIGAYKYGWKVGLLTAVASPVINNLLFGMPGAAMLPIILVKSALIVAALMASDGNKRILMQASDTANFMSPDGVEPGL